MEAIKKEKIQLFSVMAHGEENNEPVTYTGELDSNGFAIIPIGLFDGTGKHFVNAHALIDTGANISACTKSLFDKLPLNKGGELPVNSLQDNSSVIEANYWAVLHIPAIKATENIKFVVKEYLHGKTFDFIIGTWFLRKHCEFTYNKDANMFSLKFKH